MNKRVLSLIACAAFCLVCAQNPALAGAERPEWQLDYSFRNFKEIGIAGHFNLEPSFENRVGSLTFNVGHVAGQNDLPRMRAMTYDNWQPIEYEGPWGTLKGMDVDLDFGCATVPGADQGDCQIEDIQGDWTHNRILYSFSRKNGPAKIEITCSRLAPAVLARTSETELMLMAGAKALPRYAAIPVGNGTKQVDLFHELVPVSEMSSPWMLTWLADDYPLDCKRSVYAKPYQANMPVLFVFSSVPDEINIDNGLVFVFDELMTKLAVSDGGELVNGVAVMPLYGDVFPAQSEVKTWFGSGLPDDVLEKCGWWQRALSFFPVSIIETRGEYDEENDVISIGQECVGRNWTEESGDYSYAPVSPAFSLAAGMGFPIAIEGGALHDTGLITRYGPYCVVEGAASYEIKMRGLGKYVLEQRVLSDVSGIPGRVSGLLLAEVEKMLDAGSLAPWYPVPCDLGGGGGWEPPVATYGQPADTIETLAAALPFLSEVERARVIEYMKKERAAFPPEHTAQIPLDQGARRERHAVTPGVVSAVKNKINNTGFFALNKCMPADAVYGLASYYAAIGKEENGLGEYLEDIRGILEPYLLHHDWASQGWYAFRVGSRGRKPGPMYFFLGGAKVTVTTMLDPWYGNGGVADANAWMKGIIGYVRLARMAGDKEKEREAWALFGKAAALRFALGKYNGFLFKRGILPDVETCRNSIHTYSFGHHGRAYTGHMAFTNPIYIWDFRDELDYLAQLWVVNEFLVDAIYGIRISYPFFMHPACPETARFMGDWLGHETRRLVERIEENMPEWHTAYCESMIGGDGVNFIMPQDAHQIFMAKALVCKEDAERLAWLCDVPWVALGDLYYIDKLRETAYAYSKWQWTRERR